jgi:hypothetical protein
VAKARQLEEPFVPQDLLIEIENALFGLVADRRAPGVQLRLLRLIRDEPASRRLELLGRRLLPVPGDEPALQRFGLRLDAAFQELDLPLQSLAVGRRRGSSG